MGGVNRNDQLRDYYHVRLKSRKYYKYISGSCLICQSQMPTFLASITPSTNE